MFYQAQKMQELSEMESQYVTALETLHEKERLEREVSRCVKLVFARGRFP